MPTGACNYPHHHGPSAGPPLGLLVLIALGAVVLTHWHTVLIVLAVVVVLALALGAVVLLWHSHTSAPYDAAWSEPDELASPVIRVHAVAEAQRHTAELERQVAELRQAIAAGGGQHLHLHGVSAADLAAIVSRQSAAERGAIEVSE